MRDKREFILCFFLIFMGIQTFNIVSNQMILPTQVTAKSENTQVNQNVQWNQTYGGNGSDHVYALLQTKDKGFILVGETNSFGAGQLDMWVIKTNAEGVIQWNQTYGGIKGDSGYAVLEIAEGGYIFAGYTHGVDLDMWLVKTDSEGVVQWNQTYGGTEFDAAYALIQTNDGGYALAGVTESFGLNRIDMWLVKTDSEGVVQWNQTYGEGDTNYALALLQTNDGGFALTGYTDSYDVGSRRDILLVKTDGDGVVQWNQTYGGTGYETAFDLLQTAEGEFIFAGSTDSFGMGKGDMWLVKTDANGVVQWNQTYGGIESDVANALLQSTDNGIALAGSTYSFGMGEVDMWLVKTDANGVVEWNQTYGGTEEDHAYAFVQTSDGHFALAGNTGPHNSVVSYSAIDFDACLVKMKRNSTGMTKWDIIPFSFITITLIVLYGRKSGKTGKCKKI